MPFVPVSLPLYLPQWLYRPLRRAKGAMLQTGHNGLDLTGDRDVEWSYIAAKMPFGTGEALDFGCGCGNLSLLAARHGFQVLALDLLQQRFPWESSGVRFVSGDLLKLDLPKDHFDLVINCSSVEHVGLAGRYNTAESDTDGDLKAMRRLRALMKPQGVMLLTAPCGHDAVFVPFHRVYGAQRLPRLLSGFVVKEGAFWMKNRDNRWTQCTEEDALSFPPTRHPTTATLCSYALGCFVLRKPDATNQRESDSR